MNVGAPFSTWQINTPFTITRKRDLLPASTRINPPIALGAKSPQLGFVTKKNLNINGYKKKQ